MLNNDQLKLIWEEMEAGNPIPVAMKKLSLEKESAQDIRQQMLETFGRHEVVRLVREKIAPKKVEMAKSASLVIKESIRQKLKGKNILAKKEEIEKRRSICDPCGYREDKKCLKCGCFIAAKTKLQVSSCPMGKW